MTRATRSRNTTARRFRRAVLLTAVVAGGLTMGGAAQARSRDDSPNAVLVWNANAGAAALAACIAPTDNPLHESRMYAMMHLAIHDALNAIHRRSQPYAYDTHVRGRVSAPAAVAAAAHGVLIPVVGQIPAPFPPACVAAGVASAEAAYQTAVDAIPNGRAKARGIQLGEAAAAAILARRAGDGADTPLVDPAYPQGTAPGEYQFTPGTPFAFAPGWGKVTPFTLRDSDQFRPAPPDAVTSARYATDVAEIKHLGGDGVTTPSDRTADQTEFAVFWVESSPLQWNRIARTVAMRAGTDMWASARLFALLDMALADGYIGSFATKYHDNYWRPVTAIRAADTDGNPATSADPTWTPLRGTPPIPDYDSAHSVEGAAAAEVMREFFGTDRMAFTTCSLTMDAGQRCTDANPTLRSFARFSDAARENGESRILVGFHFRRAVEAGLDHGRAIAEQTVDRFLLEDDDDD